LDNGYNNNLTNTLNSHSENSTKWPYSGDASLIEPEILEDMGVSMLEDGVTNCENTKRLQSEECTILMENLASNNRSVIDDSDIFEYQEEVYTSSSLEIAISDRFVITKIAGGFKLCLLFTHTHTHVYTIIFTGFNKIHVIQMI